MLGVVSAAFTNPDGSKALVATMTPGPPEPFRCGGELSVHLLARWFCRSNVQWSGTQNGGYTVDAKTQIQASSFNTVSGLQTEGTTDTLGGYDVAFADDGDYAVYSNVNFASGITAVDVPRRKRRKRGTLEFHLDGPAGQLIGSVTIPVTGGWQKWTTVSGPVSGASGVHNLYAVFRGNTGIGNVNWFQFK